MTELKRSRDVTQLLVDWRSGDSSALNLVIERVHGDLRKRAAAYLRRERFDHTLQPTALVNEAFLRLVDQTRVDWRSRSQFLAIAAQSMRRILVDHARRRRSAKRGSGVTGVVFDEAIGGPGRGIELVALDDALHALGRLQPRQSRVVELRYFGGLGIEEVAAVLDVSPGTIKRDWAMAKAWLYRELKAD